MGTLALDLVLQSTSANSWDKLTAISTLVYAVFAGVAACAAIAAFFVIRGQWLAARAQWDAADRTRRFGVLNHIYERFHTDRSKADRYAIYTSQLRHFSDLDCEHLWRRREWRGVKLQSVERTSDLMHYIGLLENRGLIEVDDLFEYFMWPALLTYLNMARYLYWVRRHYNPRYAEHFIGLLPKLEAEFKRHYGDEMFTRRLGVATMLGLEHTEIAPARYSTANTLLAVVGGLPIWVLRRILRF